MVYGFDVKIDGVWVKAGEEVNTSSLAYLDTINVMNTENDSETSKKKGRTKKVED